jgi:hypothetical protein
VQAHSGSGPDLSGGANGISEGLDCRLLIALSITMTLQDHNFRRTVSFVIENSWKFVIEDLRRISIDRLLKPDRENVLVTNYAIPTAELTPVRYCSARPG